MSPEAEITSAKIMTGYELNDQSSIPARGRNYSLRHNVQTGSGAQRASYLMGTGGRGLSLGVKWPKRDVNVSSIHL
jgi:hypothetical protein